MWILSLILLIIPNLIYSLSESHPRGIYSLSESQSEGINLLSFNTSSYIQMLTNISTNPPNKTIIAQEFQQFVIKYKPVYSSVEELYERINIFGLNLLKSINFTFSEFSDRKESEKFGLTSAESSRDESRTGDRKKIIIIKPIYNETFFNGIKYTFKFNYTETTKISVRFVSNTTYWLNKNLLPNNWLNQFELFSFKPSVNFFISTITDSRLIYCPSGSGYLIFIDNEGNYDYVQINLINNNFPKPSISYVSPPPWNTITPINWCTTNNPLRRSMCTPVKTQKCGCCWAYNSATLLETSYSIANKLQIPVVMPPEQIMTCVPPRLPCLGGSDHSGMRYGLKHGMQIESQYPPTMYKYIYNDTKIPLICNDRENINYNFSDYCVYKPKNVQTIKKFLTLFGSAMVGTDGNIFYIGKNLIDSNTTCSVKNINHAVNLVGWSIENNKEYWIVRNSWGSSWGMNGFAKIIIDTVSNPCGILDGVTFTGPCILSEYKEIPTTTVKVTIPTTTVKVTIPTTTVKVTTPPSIIIPPICKTYGFPSLNNNIRLYTQVECNILNGIYYSSGECIVKTGGSYSWNCRGLNFINTTTTVKPTTTTVKPTTTTVKPTTTTTTVKPITTTTTVKLITTTTTVKPITTTLKPITTTVKPTTTTTTSFCSENYTIPSTVNLDKLIDINSPLLKLSVKKPVKIVFFGDSITYLGVYQDVIIKKINSSPLFIGNSISIINQGVDGGTIKDLILGFSPWGRLNFKEPKSYVSLVDVLDQIKPDIVVVQIGLNDIYQKGSYCDSSRCSDVNEFKRLLKDVIGSLVKCFNAEFVIASVTSIGENIGSSPKDIDLDNFSKAAGDVSKELNVSFVNLRDAYKQYEKSYNCKKLNSGLLTYDGVHPNSRGAIMLANMHSQGILDACLRILRLV